MPKKEINATTIINLGFKYPPSVVFDNFQYPRERDCVIETEMGNLNLCDDVLPNNFKIFVFKLLSYEGNNSQLWIETATRL